MKSERQFPRALLTRKGEKALRGGHPWVYDAEIVSLSDACENGCLVDVVSDKNVYLGTGLYSEKSKIRIRVLSANANETFDEPFWRRRVRYALDYRRTVMADDFLCCRLIFGEADGLPGLTADRYGDVVVTQVLSYGMEQRKALLYRAIADVLAEYGAPIAGIYERNDVAIRGLEGLETGKGWYEGLPHGNETVVPITENGIRYKVDVENGQKTGFFLDQKYNRAAVARICRGMRVLDCFTHTGSFALNAAAGGAEQVTAVDVSASALEM
ncbi:MAG: class I SAM-dependent rRNA methyltransferase, partial [Eubacteriales bacterium]|nr:class I SAM-dependent rRNA methyltransferase [Eubacteriales bacterium]